MSEFFRKRGDDKYAECSIEPLLDEDVEEILVYNVQYVMEDWNILRFMPINWRNLNHHKSRCKNYGMNKINIE